MSSYVGLSPKSPRDYVGPNVYISTVVTRQRAPLGTDYLQPETGKKYPVGSFWIVGNSPTTGTQGDLWYLAKIVANVAYWIKFGTGSSGPVLNINVDAHTGPGTDPVLASATGEITVTGAQVAAGTIGANVIRTDSLAANTYTIEIQRTASAAAADSTKNGVAHFSSVDFSVDSDGFVSLVGGNTPAAQKFDVDAHTGPGTDPVIPDGSGVVIVSGGQVASGTVGANAVRTNSLAANKYTIEVQRAAAAATASVNNNGISSFDSAYFTVDTNGWVQSKAGFTQGYSNLSMAYAAGTFTVQGATAALSASNPAYVTFQNPTTPGLLQTAQVIANQTFTDAAGTGNINTWRGGVPPTNTANGGTSGNWDQDMPFFLYAILGSTNDVAFAFSRDPRAKVSPAATSISKTGTILNVDQKDFFLLPGGTIVNYANRPCVCVGGFRMRNVVTGGGTGINYTVQALTTSDGIGQFHEGIVFNFPKGVNDNFPATYFSNAFTTLPAFTDNAYYYTIGRDGSCRVDVNLQNCNVAGLGAQRSTMAFPYGNYGDMGQLPYSGTASFTVGTTLVTQALFFTLGGSSRSTSGTAGSGLKLSGTATDFINTTWSAGPPGDSFELYFTYKAF